MGIEILYDKYEQLLLRFARSMTRNNDESEDLVQETFLRALSNIQLLGTLPDYQIKSWLFKVLKNCLIDKKRKEKFEVFSEFQEQENETLIETEIELKIMTEEALTQLSEKSRDIVYKRYWMCMTSSEIAKTLSIPASTVRYHLSSAMNLLKNRYKNINY